MAAIERTAYPRFGNNLSATDLARLYTPTLREVDLARRETRGDNQSLAFLVMLKSFQRLGYFPNPEEVPEAMVVHIRSSLGVDSDARDVSSRRSRQRYRDAVRSHLGVRAFGDEARRVAAEAVAEAAETMDEPADLINVAIEELIKERFELPVFSTLDRLARHVRHTINSRLFAGIDERLPDSTRRLLDSLLESGTSHRSDLNALKAVPKSATRKNLKELQERLLWLESLADTSLLLEGIPNQKIANLAAQARALDASELKKVSGQRRRAMLACLIHRAKVGVRDGLAEMLVKIMGKVHKSGKEELESLHREKRATTEHLIGLLEKILAGAHQLEGDDAALGKEVRRVLADGGGAEALLEAAISLSVHRGGNYLPLLWKFYKGKRATLFRVLASLQIRPTTEDGSLADALEFVLENQHRRGEFIAGELDLSFASERWRELVVAENDGKPALARRHLEVCVFSHVAAELKTGDLYVEGSETYADYREQLLSWEECEPLVEQHCTELSLAPEPEGFARQLKDMLSQTAEEVDYAYPENSSVVIAEDGEPVLKKITGKKPSRSAKLLESAIAERMPERNLPDIICAGEYHTNWSKHLGPLSGSEPKLENPRERYLVTAFGYGTNMGPVQTARHTRGLVSAHMLGYVNRRHTTTANLELAITHILHLGGQTLPRIGCATVRPAQQG